MRVLGRSGNSRTADSAREVLSPTLRARKASPQRRVSDPDVSRDRAARNRMNHCDMQLPGGHASPMVIADPFTPLPLNRDALSDSNVWLSASAGGVKQMAATQNHVRDADLLPLSLTNSRGRTIPLSTDFRRLVLGWAILGPGSGFCFRGRDCTLVLSCRPDIWSSSKRPL